MAFRQQQPVILGVLDQSAPRLHQSLLLGHDAIAAITGLMEDSGKVFLITEWIEGDNLEYKQHRSTQPLRVRACCSPVFLTRSSTME